MLKNGLMAVGMLAMIIGAAILFFGSGFSLAAFGFMGAGLVGLIVGFLLPH